MAPLLQIEGFNFCLLRNSPDFSRCHIFFFPIFWLEGTPQNILRRIKSMECVRNQYQLSFPTGNIWLWLWKVYFWKRVENCSFADFLEESLIYIRSRTQKLDGAYFPFPFSHLLHSQLISDADQLLHLIRTKCVKITFSML